MHLKVTLWLPTPRVTQLTQHCKGESMRPCWWETLASVVQRSCLPVNTLWLCRGSWSFSFMRARSHLHLKYFHEQRNLNACQDLSACCFGAYKRCNIHSAFSCGRVETCVYILPCEGCITQLGQPHCELVIIGFALLKHHNEEVEWWTLTALHYVVCYDGEVSSQSCFLTCLNSWGFHCWL